MPIQNRQYVYPEFVDQIYKELSVEVAEMIVKNVIMTHVEKKNENEFKISKTTLDMSNHCETQDLKGTISALSIFTIFYASEIGVQIENLNNTELLDALCAVLRSYEAACPERYYSDDNVALADDVIKKAIG